MSATTPDPRYDDQTVYNKHQSSCETDEECSNTSDCGCCAPGLVQVYDECGKPAGCLTPNDAALYNANKVVPAEGFVKFQNPSTCEFIGMVPVSDVPTLLDAYCNSCAVSPPQPPTPVFDYYEDNSVIPFNNIGDGALLSSYVIPVGEDGVYSVSAINSVLIPLGNVGRVDVLINGAAPLASQFFENQNTDDIKIPVSVTWIGNLVAGDTVEIYGFSGTGSVESDRQVHNIHKL